MIYQEQTAESLTSPAHSKRQDIGRGYRTLAENLVKFSELDMLPRSLLLSRINEGQGIEVAMNTNKARWHHSRMLRYNNTMLRGAEKRKCLSSVEDSRSIPCKHSRLRSSRIEEELLSFFCELPAGTEGLHEASTLQVDCRVASLLEDSLLLAKLSAGDMVALEVKYYTKCLLTLYNKARKVRSDTEQGSNRDREVSGIALAELVVLLRKLVQI